MLSRYIVKKNQLDELNLGGFTECAVVFKDPEGKKVAVRLNEGPGKKVLSLLIAQIETDINELSTKK